MKRSATTDHAQIRAYKAKRGRKQPTHKYNNERSAWRGNSDPIVFIITAVLAAGTLAAAIRANQLDISGIWSPRFGIVASEARATNRPHDDICTDASDDTNGTSNIKGFFERRKWRSDCLARQTSEELQLID